MTPSGRSGPCATRSGQTSTPSGSPTTRSSSTIRSRGRATRTPRRAIPPALRRIHMAGRRTGPTPSSRPRGRRHRRRRGPDGSRRHRRRRGRRSIGQSLRPRRPPGPSSRAAAAPRALSSSARHRSPVAPHAISRSGAAHGPSPADRTPPARPPRQRPAPAQPRPVRSLPSRPGHARPRLGRVTRAPRAALAPVVPVVPAAPAVPAAQPDSSGASRRAAPRGPQVPPGLARTTLGLVAILVLATTGLGVVTSALPKAKPPATPATAAPYSARWICPLLPNQSASIGMANVGGNPATLRTTVVGAAGASQTPQKPIAAGSGGQASCASGPTDRWWIPAADTSLGASTTVVVANPDNDPAVVDLVPHVNQGALAAAAELFVPPRSAKIQTLSNGELIALRPAIEVIAKSGRVVAGAVISQKDQQKIFVPGQPTTRSQWSFAGGLAGTDRSTSVLITNPSASPLSVSVQVSTDQGTFRPGNDFDNPIPGGSSAAIQVP